MNEQKEAAHAATEVGADQPHWITRLSWRWPAPETLDSLVLGAVVVAGMIGLVYLVVTR